MGVRDRLGVDVSERVVVECPVRVGVGCVMGRGFRGVDRGNDFGRVVGGLGGFVGGGDAQLLAQLGDFLGRFFMLWEHDRGVIFGLSEPRRFHRNQQGKLIHDHGGWCRV